MDILTYEEAKEIYEMMNDHLDNTDEDIMDLYNTMIGKAVRYAHIRAGWPSLSRQEKQEQDSFRTAAHDGFISLINGVARTEGEAGRQWRERLSQDRRRIGDFACYIALFEGISAR